MGKADKSINNNGLKLKLNLYNKRINIKVNRYKTRKKVKN